MATAKFKDASPYVKPAPKPPTEDYLYSKYVEDLALKVDSAFEKNIGLALFGVGRAGTIHLSTIVTSPEVKLLYIVDDNESKWEPLRKYWHLEGVTFLNSKQADKVYKDSNVDAVIVATPTGAHERIVAAALKARKAVFCEKPIAESREDTIRCYETAKKVGRPLFCAFNRRFDPSFSAVYERVRRGEVGHVHTIKTVSRDSPLPSIEYLKHSGGIFHDCMVHDIDIITWVLGEYPIKVAVQASANIPEIRAINDYDTVLASFHFASGTLGMIDLSRHACYGYDQRLEVFGPKGMVGSDNEQPIHAVTTCYGHEGLKTAPIWYSFPSRYRLGYRREFAHFIDVVKGKAECAVRPEETLAICKIVHACEESIRTGKIVELKWADGELPPPK